jgi:hypothetical protein
MNENIRKTLLYFKKWNTYWNLTDKNEKLAVSVLKPGRYPLDFKNRIREGHYPHFDDRGVPMWFNTNGGYLYHYTTMFSYALGQWDFYLLTGERKHLDIVLNVADYVVKSGVREDGGLLLREADGSGSHTGDISAMTQGEAISVLTRAWSASGKDEYLESAKRCLIPFTKKIENGGVVGVITKMNIEWYEEYITKPLNHVLNGKIYSLWGLRDLALAEESMEAEKLFNKGVDSVEKALELFDTGYWSWYWSAETGENYIASMMYHNLHICQLTALGEQTGREKFFNYADKFISYAKSPVNRFRAVKQISGAKLSNKT